MLYIKQCTYTHTHKHPPTHKLEMVSFQDAAYKRNSHAHTDTTTHTATHTATNTSSNHPQTRNGVRSGYCMQTKMLNKHTRNPNIHTLPHIYPPTHKHAKSKHTHPPTHLSTHPHSCTRRHLTAVVTTAVCVAVRVAVCVAVCDAACVAASVAECVAMCVAVCVAVCVAECDGCERPLQHSAKMHTNTPITATHSSTHPQTRNVAVSGRCI